MMQYDYGLTYINQTIRYIHFQVLFDNLTFRFSRFHCLCTSKYLKDCKYFNEHRVILHTS